LDTDIKRGTRKGSPNYSIGFKRRLAIAACEPDVSVSKLALSHQVNANMVFKWRRQFRAGLFGAEPAFLQVALAPPSKKTAPPSPAPLMVAPEARIEIRIADAIVHIHGAVDAQVLRTVLQSLRP
jgi:transposase